MNLKRVLRHPVSSLVYFGLIIGASLWWRFYADTWFTPPESEKMKTSQHEILPYEPWRFEYVDHYSRGLIKWAISSDTVLSLPNFVEKNHDSLFKHKIKIEQVEHKGKPYVGVDIVVDKLVSSDRTRYLIDLEPYEAEFMGYRFVSGYYVPVTISTEANKATFESEYFANNFAVFLVFGSVPISMILIYVVGALMVRDQRRR